MKKISFVLIAAVMLASLTISALASTYGYVIFSGDCNVRTGPGLDYGTIGAVASGGRLDYEGDYSYDNRGVCWYKVYYNGSIGWVSSVYATLYENSYDMDDDYYSDQIEPYMPLTFQTNARGEWEEYSGDNLGMRVKVTNISKYTTVKAFEIYMYATDVWGDRLYGDTGYYYLTTTKRVGPGESAFSDYMKLPYRSRISTVYAGIKRVICTDGTILENDTVDYWSWPIS